MGVATGKSGFALPLEHPGWLTWQKDRRGPRAAQMWWKTLECAPLMDQMSWDFKDYMRWWGDNWTLFWNLAMD